MTDRDEQLDQFEDAVERKKAEAEEASHHAAQNPGSSAVGDADRPDVDPRAKNSRHGQVTADKWNQ